MIDRDLRLRALELAVLACPPELAPPGRDHVLRRAQAFEEWLLRPACAATPCSSAPCPPAVARP